jgi:TonB family protein
MFRRAVFAVLLITGFWPGWARSDDKILCSDQKAEVEARIAACTNLLESGDPDEHEKSQILLGRGAAYFQKSDFDRALVDYNEAISNDPHNADAFWSRGNAYWTMVEDKSAFMDFDEAIRLNPMPAYFLARASRYISILKSELAIADLTQVIAIDPRFAAAYRSRGVAYGQQKEFDRALADFDHTLQIDPGDTKALTERRLAYDAKGENLKTNADYDCMLVARLEIQKAFPRQASREKWEGTAQVTFVISREGKLISSSIKATSGWVVLDQAALDTVRRAQPVPPLPDGCDASKSFSIPMIFRISSLHKTP